MSVQTRPVPIVKMPVAGYLASVVNILNMARAGYKVTVDIPGHGQIKIAYAGGKYNVAGRSFVRAKASGKIQSALNNSVGATFVVSM